MMRMARFSPAERSRVNGAAAVPVYKLPPRGGGYSLLYSPKFGHDTGVASSSADQEEWLRLTKNLWERVKAVLTKVVRGCRPA